MGVLNHYKELLPITDKTPIVNLEEGLTPLIPLPRVSKRLGISLYGKFEGCNPSGSFKDRGMVLAVAKASTPSSEVTGLFCRIPWPEFSRAP